MSMIYRYGLQQRPAYTIIAEVTLTDPSPELVVANAASMAMIQASCIAHQMEDRGSLLEPPIHPDLPLTGVVVYESVQNTAGGFSYPVMMAYTMSEESLDHVEQLFRDNVWTQLPTPTKGRKHKR